mmetsp:Transcript_855/g.2638  ORF Transcript_855/g.2638 Transcript_855/m.2638 type:complete len:226 (+) Transcript_855:660-1337(+)
MRPICAARCSGVRPCVVCAFGDARPLSSISRTPTRSTRRTASKSHCADAGSPASLRSPSADEPPAECARASRPPSPSPSPSAPGGSLPSCPTQSSSRGEELRPTLLPLRLLSASITTSSDRRGGASTPTFTRRPPPPPPPCAPGPTPAPAPPNPPRRRCASSSSSSSSTAGCHASSTSSPSGRLGTIPGSVQWTRARKRRARARQAAGTATQTACRRSTTNPESK